jgi:hypothetical protein
MRSFDLREAKLNTWKKWRKKNDKNETENKEERQQRQEEIWLESMMNGEANNLNSVLNLTEQMKGARGGA